MSLKLATVVVTYNRKELLLRNLQSQFAQTLTPDCILIIDNGSTDGTKDYLEAQGVLARQNVKYYNTGANLGGAGGFEYGIRRAHETDCDVYCLMDDDGYALDGDTFALAMKKIQDLCPENDTPIFINSLVLRNETEVTFPFDGTLKDRSEVIALSENGFFYENSSPFNSTFINRKLVETIGYPRGEFFLRFDEVDYFQRAKACGAIVGVVTDSLYYHPATSEYENKVFLGKPFSNDYEAGWKEYYKTRNSFVLMLEDGMSRQRLFRKYLYKLAGLQVFQVKDRKALSEFITAGYRDAVNGQMGKRIDPGQKRIKG